MKPINILISAYACEPGKGSDPGIGWNIAREIARNHQVWVVTRTDNRPSIEAELAQNPVPQLHFIYYDIPYWMRWWKKGLQGVQIHYYLWQLGVYGLVRSLHQEIGFDVSHHITYVKHWGPSLLSLLPIPFVWGPVGGGESAPASFWRDFHQRGKIYEILRDIARWIGEHDPLVRLTASHCAVALAATPETADRLRLMGCQKIKIEGVAGIPQADLEKLAQLPPPPQTGFRLVSIGRLLHWKGFYLGLRAFAQLNLPDTEYWIIGDGPDRRQLMELAHTLGIESQVKFWGTLAREETLNKLAQCHVLVHPSLHDSGGWVCLEAMAAAKPVICLDVGGPAIQVTADTGLVVAAPDSAQAVKNLAEAMFQLAQNPELRAKLGRNGQHHVREHYDWSVKSRLIAQIYESVTKPLPVRELICES